MTVLAKDFQVRWMVCSTLAKFEGVVTTAVCVFYLMAAVLAFATIPNVNPLLDLNPQVNRHPSVPGKADSRKFADHKEVHYGLLFQIKLSDHEAPKFGTEIPDPYSFAGQRKNIGQDFKRQFVIDDVDLEGKFPSSFEGGTDANDTGALNDYRTNIEIQRFVGIGIQFLWDIHAKQNFSGVDKNTGREEVFVGLTPFSGDLESGGGLDHSALEMAGRLVNMPVCCGVKITAPFFGVIHSSRAFLSTLREGFDVWNGETVLEQRGCSLDFDTYGIHCFLLKENEISYYRNKTMRTVGVKVEFGTSFREVAYVTE